METEGKSAMQKKTLLILKWIRASKYIFVIQFWYFSVENQTVIKGCGASVRVERRSQSLMSSAFLTE